MCFPISVWEDPEQINLEWISRWLGIGKVSGIGNRTMNPKSDRVALVTNQKFAEKVASVRMENQNNLEMTNCVGVGKVGNTGRGSNEKFKGEGGVSKSMINKGKDFAVISTTSLTSPSLLSIAKTQLHSHISPTRFHSLTSPTRLHSDSLYPFFDNLTVCDFPDLRCHIYR
ncbi:hypothetical protein LWI28_028532 [Acer negundo]|uniref:Uncharacterized protein n=1 Tax=Acer negundo TaxID=4023 RepID=A0AAD5IPD2_ACENE|nr:hypothetical protein LWI28_028532 [Acer negundo]